MSSVTDSLVLAFFGVGRFPEEMDKEKAPIISAVNVAGWIPVVSIIAGIARCVFGVSVFVSGADYAEERIAFGIQIVRGLAEICCVGCIAAPVDLVVTAVRLVRDYYSSRPSEAVN